MHYNLIHSYIQLNTREANGVAYQRERSPPSYCPWCVKVGYIALPCSSEGPAPTSTKLCQLEPHISSAASHKRAQSWHVAKH